MKRICSYLAVLVIFLLPVCVFAQTAKVVDLKGEVLIKRKPGLDWEDAKMNMFLEKSAEVQTKKKSECTLAFDEELKNILTLKENSHIKIDEVKPGNVFLPEGRVFSLIKNLAQRESFEVRTPTAIAGARGTGWASEHRGGTSSFSCFDDSIFVEGLDENGNTTGQKVLGEGFGTEVDNRGEIGEPHDLAGKEYSEWDNFVDSLQNLSQEEEMDTDSDSLNDARLEGRESFKDSLDESRRRDEETLSEEGRSGGSTGGTGYKTGGY